MPGSTLRVELVRPGEPALEWLGGALSELKEADPLAPVTLVPANMVAGRMALRRLAGSAGYVNVRVARLGDLAAAMARPLLVGREELTPVLEASAARAAARDTPQLRDLAGHNGLTDALAGVFRELRREELDLLELAEKAGPVGRAALEAYGRFRELTADLIDGTEVRHLAVDRLRSGGGSPAELGSLIVFLPTRLDPVDVELLSELARRIPVIVALAEVADPQGLGDRRAHDDYSRLAGTDAPEAHARALPLPPDTRIVCVPDPAEEAREVVRAVAASMEAGTPLPRIAVLYRQPEVYEPLLRDAFALAGLPCFPLSGAALEETRPGRLLLELLRLPERSFGRETVLGVVAASPLFLQAEEPSPATWDRLSRDANVVRGVDQWTGRLRVYADRMEARSGPADESTPSRAERARHMAAVIEEMAELLRPPADGAGWPELTAWATRAYERFCGPAELWPKEERGDYELVVQALASLTSAGRFETVASRQQLLAALEEALGSASRPVGQLGTGAVLGPLQSIAGMPFDEVFLVGLNEGAFPPPPAVEPFFGTPDGDLLGLRAQARRREREAFLTAMASAGRRLTLSTAQSADGRAAFPSRWLLEVASALAGGQPIIASAFGTLDEGAHPWLRTVRSAQQGVATSVAAADLEDRRLAEASAWVRAGGDLGASALAHRDDLPLGRALAATAARRSDEFTAFDGNVGELAERAAAIAQLFTGQRPMAATTIEKWAACPFSYFLAQVLRIRPSEAPEDRWTIDAASRGTLVHRILEEFLRREAEADPPLGIRPYDDADRELLREIAERHFEELRTSGSAGNPMVWQATVDDVWADLETFLREDQAWRAEQGWQPVRFEQLFGFEEDDETSWPALDLEVDGLQLRFRGQIDRIDLSGSGTRAFLYDYKTGRTDDYKAVQLDPVIAGRALQLALYAEVAKRNLSHPSIDAAYWFISSRGGFAMHGLRQPADQVSARLHTVLGHVARGIRQGVFPAVSGDEDEYYGTFDNCRWCPYDRVCPSARDQLWLAKRRSGGCEAYEQLALPASAE